MQSELNTGGRRPMRLIGWAFIAASTLLGWSYFSAGEARSQEAAAPSAAQTAPAHGAEGAAGSESGAHAAEAGHAEAAEGEHGGGEAHGAKHEKGFSIHQPTWLYGLLQKIWYSGPASVSAQGAYAADDPSKTPIPASELVNKKAEAEYQNHHSEQENPPVYQIQPTIAAIGEAKASSFSEIETVTVEGRKIALVTPVFSFALAAFLSEALVVSLLTALTIAIVAFLLTRNLTRVPSRKQMFVEGVYEWMDDFVHQIVGAHYKRYVPLVFAGFIYILFMNLAGLIPGWTSPTANINIPAGMALVVVAYVQYEGIRVNGIIGYLKHFVGEPAWLGPLNFPLHVTGELARLLSLTIRLFGNIFGEDVVIVILISLSVQFTKGLVPAHAVMDLLAIFTSFVQALVFSILTCVYIALATTHEEHEGHHEHDEGHHAPHDAVAVPA